MGTRLELRVVLAGKVKGMHASIEPDHFHAVAVAAGKEQTEFLELIHFFGIDFVPVPVALDDAAHVAVHLLREARRAVAAPDLRGGAKANARYEQSESIYFDE